MDQVVELYAKWTRELGGRLQWGKTKRRDIYSNQFYSLQIDIHPQLRLTKKIFYSQFEHNLLNVTSIAFT